MSGGPENADIARTGQGIEQLGVELRLHAVGAVESKERRQEDTSRRCPQGLGVAKVVGV